VNQFDWVQQIRPGVRTEDMKTWPWTDNNARPSTGLDGITSKQKLAIAA
jgi:hypothetical protein